MVPWVVECLARESVMNGVISFYSPRCCPPPPHTHTHCRLIVQSLPLILVGGIVVVMAATRVLQLVQTRVLHVLPFGALGQFSLLDVCVGILVSGLFMMYFGACRALHRRSVSMYGLHPPGLLYACLAPLQLAHALFPSAVERPSGASARVLLSHTPTPPFDACRILRVLLYVRTCPVVVKSSFVPFDCVSLGAVRVLESEPTVLCDTTVGPYARMRAVAAVSVLAFVLGLPAALAVFLGRNWHKVQQDQRLRERGEGDSALTNPHFHFRRRFRKVYEDYRPAHAYWKVVVLLRKLCLGLVVVLANGYVVANLAIPLRALCVV